MKYFLNLKDIPTIFLILNLLVSTMYMGNAEAGNDYLDALMEIPKIFPDSGEEVKEDFEEEEKSSVEFSADMKYLNITLKDSIILALKNNYDIKIAKLGPKIEGKDITAAKAAFDPFLKITGKRNVSETPSDNQLVLGGIGGGGVEITEFKNDSNTLQATLEKPIETGAKFTLDFNLGIRSFLDPAPFRPLNPQSTASIEAKLTQPLLRNAGIFYNRSEIYIARNDKKKSVLQLKETAIGVVNDAQKAYWELVKAIEELRVRNKSLERAKDLLRRNKIQAKVGTLAPIDVVEAEEGVAKQLEGVVIAENDIKDREDDLKQVMNLSSNSILSDVSIVPLDKASFEIKNVSLDESIKIALGNRPELFEQRLDIENNKIRVKQRRNELLPKFDFEAGIRYNGLAGNSENALDSAFSERFQSEFFGVTLEVPMLPYGNREARSNYSKAKLEARQSVLNINKIEQEVIVEVRKAVRAIKTNVERIKATEKARELAQKRLEAEEKKFEVGRTTSIEVLRAQENLAISEGKATNAKVDYQTSLGELDAVMGTNLEKSNIIIEDDGFEVKRDLKQKAKQP